MTARKTLASQLPAVAGRPRTVPGERCDLTPPPTFSRAFHIWVYVHGEVLSAGPAGLEQNKSLHSPVLTDGAITFRPRGPINNCLINIIGSIT